MKRKIGIHADRSVRAPGTSDDRNARVGLPRRSIAAVVVVAIAVGVLLALRGSGEFLLYGEEFHSLRYVERPYADLVGFYGRGGVGGGLLVLQRAAIDVFGAGFRAFRFPAILGAIGTLLLMYPAGARLVGRTPAAIATLALALNSVHVFYSGFGRAYALAVFLGLCLVYSLARALDRAESKPGWYAVAAVSAGLLPYVYLSALAFTASVAVAAFATVAYRHDAGRNGLWLLATFGVAALLCLALYLPAWEPLWKFIRYESVRGTSLQVHWLDAAALLAGSRAVGVVWLVGAPAAAAWFVVRRGGEALLPVIAAFSMPFALLLAGSTEDPYATAPYLLVGLPFVLLLLAWAIAAGVRAVGLPARASGHAELAAGVLAVAIAVAAGPLGSRRVDDGPFAGSYLSLMPLPAFDSPWPEAPAVYDIFAQADRPLRIVEAPALADQSVALYRNYYLRHRRPVAIGTATEEFPTDTAGLLVPVSDVDATKADYLVLHVDVAQELERYWDYVFRERWRHEEDPSLAAFMAFHREFSALPPPPLHTLVPGLRRRLGKPFYRDEDVIVWQLEP